MPPRRFEIQKHDQIEAEFNGVYSINKLSKIKYETYVINLDEYKSIVTPWIALYVSNNNLIYFHSFGVKHIPKEAKKFIGNKNIYNNNYIIIIHIIIYRLKIYDSIM